MALDRTRYTHPNPAQIGKPFVGDLGGALEGEVFTEEYTGTLGPVGARGGAGRRRRARSSALVSVGITIAEINGSCATPAADRCSPPLAVLALPRPGPGWSAAGCAGRRTAWAAGDHPDVRVLHAVLHAVREGLVLVDDQGRVPLVNDEATPAARAAATTWSDGRVADLALPPGLVAAA